MAFPGEAMLILLVIAASAVLKVTRSRRLKRILIFIIIMFKQKDVGFLFIIGFKMDVKRIPVE